MGCDGGRRQGQRRIDQALLTGQFQENSRSGWLRHASGYIPRVAGDDLLASAGTLRATYAAVDWAHGPLGPMSSWSQALRHTLDLVLHTRFPATLLWGPELVLLYNEAYAPLIADKHPGALGGRAEDVFPEAWDLIGPLLRSVMAGGAATWIENAHVPLERQGFLEECYFTFSYSPVRSTDEGSRATVEGILDIATETTRQVLDRRRLLLLTQLGDQLAPVRTAGEVLDRAGAILQAATSDFSAAEIRLEDLAKQLSTPSAPGDVILQETPQGQVAWLPLTMADGADGRASVWLLLNPHLSIDDPHLGFLRLIASALTQALDRVRIHEAERRAAAAERGLSEALQRSLLTKPIEPDHLQVAVRYLPAAEQAQVGGDWYDSFLLPDGTLTMVIGDVTGHDREAAAAMAQLRNLLRGVAFTLIKPPGLVLGGLDQAMYGLAVDAFATAIVAQVDRDGSAGRGMRTLRWSNAGHPPPILIRQGGSAQLLEKTPDLLLGLGGEQDRGDHETPLAPGDSVVFYTDGLVERRGAPLSSGLTWLTGVLAKCQGMNAEEICDRILGALDGTVEDDIALLVLRAYSEAARGPAPPDRSCCRRTCA